MNQISPLPGGEVALYQAPDGKVRLDVRLEQDSVWLTQAQMAELLGRERSVITKHINNVFKEGELDRSSVCANFAHPAEDGKTYSVQHFNLDVIISTGYRVKSVRGTQFRIWATRTLRDHLVQGYKLNERRLLNTVSSAELDREPTVAKTATVAAEGIVHQLFGDKPYAIIEELPACARSAGRNEALAA